MLNYLEFESPIAKLEEQIEELRRVEGQDEGLNLSAEIKRLKKKSDQLTQSIFQSLSAAQIVQVARHPLRPYTRDYINHIFTEFDELYGDRSTAAGYEIIGGVARLNDKPVVIIGHQKGRETKEKLKRNFGMPRPETYRKALRLMRLAERFALPILSFIDTPGAYPGIDAEERNQSEAIARNLFELSKLRTPIICTVIGEGGSGGALAIGVGDSVFMLEYSIYSVISPEGCASILWKNAERAKDAAEAMQITAPSIKKLGIVDDVIPEPLGGAHRDLSKMAKTLKDYLVKELAVLQSYTLDELVEKRYARLLNYGISAKQEA